MKNTNRGYRQLLKCAAFVLCLILMIGLFTACGVDPDAIVPANIYVAGVDIGGMRVQDAISAVTLAAQNYASKDMEISIYDSTVTVSAAGAAVTLDAEKAVHDAYRYGEKNVPTSRYDADILPYFTINEEAVRAELALIGRDFNSAFKETSYEVIGDMPSLAPLAEGEEEPECQVLQIVKGTSEYAFDVDAIYDAILNGYNTGNLHVTMPDEPKTPKELDLEALYEEYYIAPVDAVMDEKTFEVADESYGYAFDLDAAITAFNEAEEGQTVQIPFARIKPEVIATELRSLLFRDVLSSYTAYQASSSNRATNLRLACEAVNGTVLYPGDVFSYNDTLGERTAEKGYKAAAAYSGSETVSAIGGGICQVSSTLYYCSLVADLEVLERDCHRFASGYVPLGMDATVNWGTIDLKFRNTTNYPLRIEAYADGGSVTVKFIGTDDKDYYVVPKYSLIRSIPYTTVTQVMTSDNEKGYKDGEVITSPYTGYEVNTYRYRYDKATDELIEDEFERYSAYAKRDKEVCKIEDPTEPTTEPTVPPTEPTTEPTAPPTESTDPPTEPMPPIEDGGITPDGGGELPPE